MGVLLELFPPLRMLNYKIAQASEPKLSLQPRWHWQKMSMNGTKVIHKPGTIELATLSVLTTRARQVCLCLERRASFSNMTSVRGRLLRITRTLVRPTSRKTYCSNWTKSTTNTTISSTVWPPAIKKFLMPGALSAKTVPVLILFANVTPTSRSLLIWMNRMLKWVSSGTTRR